MIIHTPIAPPSLPPHLEDGEQQEVEIGHLPLGVEGGEEEEGEEGEEGVLAGDDEVRAK